MPVRLAELSEAFDELGITKQPTFTQLVRGGRLRYGSALGHCDLIDDYSSRLVCECISRRLSLLMIWPDSQERRAPLALAAGIVCDSVPRMSGPVVRSRILYVGADATVREQFASVRVGKTPLAGVFAQEFGRSDGPLQRVGPESSLPVVTTIVSPAESDRIIRTLRPRWIAVDCGRTNPPGWLPGLLSAARRADVPVIGWTTLHLSSVVDLWNGHGACVYRWPKIPDPVERIGSLDELSRSQPITEIIPIVLDGDAASELSMLLAQAYVRLVRHVGTHHGQLAQGSLSAAWRYLRLLESLPVPPDLYDAECTNYWGMPSLSQLQQTLERFLRALDTGSPLHADISAAYDNLRKADRMLREEMESPLWLATANLMVEARSPSLFAFQSRAHRDLFRFALLSKFNMSEDDLKGLGVSLSSLPDLSLAAESYRGRRITVVGLPRKQSEWRLEAAMDCAEMRIILMPHLEDALRRRASEWSVELDGGFAGPSPIRIAPSRDGADKRLLVGRTELLRASEMKIGSRLPSHRPPMELWKQPDAAEAIRALFGSQCDEEDAAENSVAFSRPENELVGDDASADGEWIESALLAIFDDKSQILIPIDDYVNVIAHVKGGISIEQRYSRSLRAGDEILLVNGGHRRGVYDLLVSRVHSHATIAPWLQLVDRWHQELRRAFISAKRRDSATFESVLSALRKSGSAITTAASVRGWVLGITLAPSDWQDIKRLGNILDVSIAKQYAREIGNAAGRLAGLHRSLSNRLNRWLESEGAGTALLSGAEAVVDADLGLTIDDFKHSLVRGRISSVSHVQGPFLLSQIGHLQRTVQ